MSKLSTLEQKSESLVVFKTFSLFMDRIWRTLNTEDRMQKRSSDPEEELLRMTTEVFWLYLRLIAYSEVLKKTHKKYTSNQVKILFRQFIHKCWARVSGGPNTVNKGPKVKHSYIVCDNLQDSEEELLDINNYNFLLWLKLKHFPEYLQHEISRTDYRTRNKMIHDLAPIVLKEFGRLQKEKKVAHV